MILSFFFFFFVLFSQLNTIDSRCHRNPFCRFFQESNTIICDAMYSHENGSGLFPDLSCLPHVNTYLFRNFHEINLYAFENITFIDNQSYIIQLINIEIINSETFSQSINIPENSTLSIIIKYLNNLSNIILKPNTFNQIKLNYLQFFNLNHFNGHTTFDTNWFGNNLYINELIFEQCNITGFTNFIHKTTNISHLSIINSPSLTQLTDKNLPKFLSTIKTFQISNTNLQIINKYTFQSWTLIFEELIISNNSNFETFPNNIVSGVLMKLNKLDLSYNSIKNLDINYDWSPYSYTKYLILKNQQIDLFLKTNILKTLTLLQIIDLSQGFISENNNDLIKNYFPSMSNLIFIDISYTNLTEYMIIDLLDSLSQTTDHFINIRLHGHTLNDENFCSYFQIFKNAPNLLILELDDTHQCNCVIDLFYMNKLQNITNDSLLEPTCLLNSSRTRCNIQTQLSLSKCKTDGQNSEESDTDDNIGKYAFGAVVGGLTILVLILISLGFNAVYRIRRRRNTILSMEQPIENPLDAIIEEHLQDDT